MTANAANSVWNAFTRQGSLVRSQYRPLTKGFWNPWEALSEKEERALCPRHRRSGRDLKGNMLRAGCRACAQPGTNAIGRGPASKHMPALPEHMPALPGGIEVGRTLEALVA